MVSYICCNCTNGYSPYILNGECRFCYGKNIQITNEKYNIIIKKINQIITHININIEHDTINN
jgi:hypothetical protein